MAVILDEYYDVVMKLVDEAGQVSDWSKTH